MMVDRRISALCLAFLIACIAISACDAKGGRGGFGGGRSSGGSRGWGGSSGKSSSGSSWFSRPSSSRPSPSYTHSAPSPSPSYTHSAPAPAPSYGWNTNSRGSSGNTHSNAPSYGWNVPNNSPVGPPPAYPGLQNRPVPGYNSPPAYSPSYRNPPAYNPGYGGNVYRTNNYNTQYGGYSNPASYGRTFGSSGLPANTYISNNYYGGSSRSGGSGFLTNALFYGAGMHHGYMWGGHSSHHYHYNDHHRRSEWNEDSDRRWRATTQAPYFANKVPGEEKVLPASAVIGAATAFGLASLLPLNVPARKPLMYCNDTDLAQSQIRIDNGFVYQCTNNTVEISCLKSLNNANSTAIENATASEGTRETTTSAPAGICENRLMVCSDEEGSESIFCKNGTLFSKDNIFCNSTVIVNGTDVNQTMSILNCYKGELADSQASFIPTTTQAPPTTTEKSLSLAARMHVFFLGILGRSDILEKKETTTAEPDIPELSSSEETPWVPEALTIPPETTTTTTTTTEAPFKWMMKFPKHFENGTYGIVLKEVPQYMLDIQELSNADSIKWFGSTTENPFYTKVYITESTTAATQNSTEESTTEEAAKSTTEEAAKSTSDASN